MLQKMNELDANMRECLQALSQEIGLIDPPTKPDARAGAIVPVGAAGAAAGAELATAPQTPSAAAGPHDVLMEATPSKTKDRECSDDAKDVIAIAEQAIAQANVIRVAGMFKDVKKATAKAKAEPKAKGKGEESAAESAGDGKGNGKCEETEGNDGNEGNAEEVRKNQKDAAIDGFLLPVNELFDPAQKLSAAYHMHDELLVQVQAVMMQELRKSSAKCSEWFTRFHYEVSKKVALYLNTSGASKCVNDKRLPSEFVLPLFGNLAFEPNEGHQLVGQFLCRNVYLVRPQNAKYYFGNLVQESTAWSSFCVF